jgi:hypothetical protein
MESRGAPSGDDCAAASAACAGANPARSRIVQNLARSLIEGNAARFFVFIVQSAPGNASKAYKRALIIAIWKLSSAGSFVPS